MKRFPSLIGVVHLPALCGAPGSTGATPFERTSRAIEQAIREVEIYSQNRFDGVILENFGDVPFFKDRVPAETTASMAAIAHEVRQSCKLAVGINVLRNDWRSALAVASVTGCDFIRVNVLSGVVATDQGIIEGEAAELSRQRAALHAPVAVFADAQVKHARSLSSDDLELEIEELVLRAGADAVIVTGRTTGRAVDFTKLEAAGEAATKLKKPLYIGSGATAENLSELMEHASGVIVGSALRKDGKAGAPVEADRVAAFSTSFYRSRKS